MTRSLAILLASMALLSAACGATGEQQATDEDTATTTTEVREASGSFGSLEEVCGPGEARIAEDEAGRGTDKLYIGVANDRGAQLRPGVNKELWDASNAFAAWCNEQGGIAGLQIELVDLDGKLLEVQSAMATACTDVFAMVGGAFIQDNLEFSGDPTSDFHECGLIDIPAFAVSVQKGLSNGQVQPVPNPPNRRSTQWILDFKEEFPEESRSNVVVYGEIPSLKVVKAQFDAAVQEVGGIKQLPPLSYPVTGLTDWTPLAQSVIDSGATSLYWIGEPTNAANLFKALRDQGWDGVILNETNVYDPLVFSAGDRAAEGIVVRSAFHPFEEADRWPAIRQYQENLRRYVPGGKQASLGLQSTSAWLLFATAVRACAERNDGLVDRTCVLQQAAAQDNWTGGGLHVPTDPGGTEPPECGMLLIARGGAFERFVPEIGSERDDLDGFHCPPDSVVAVTADLGAEGAVDPSRPI
jgi:ABC-type branched-subunit amino acid transport system substrate-binding protein